jgi:hypothetical protein
MVIDPYAKLGERLRSKSRTQGRREDEFDALIRAASQEMGAAAEAALGILVDIAEGVGLRYLEDAARMGGGSSQFAPRAVRAARAATSRLPSASGRALSTSAETILHAGFSVLRELRRRLESGRRRVRPAGHPRPPASGTSRGRSPSPADIPQDFAPDLAEAAPEVVTRARGARGRRAPERGRAPDREERAGERPPAEGPRQPDSRARGERRPPPDRRAPGRREPDETRPPDARRRPGRPPVAPEGPPPSLRPTVRRIPARRVRPETPPSRRPDDR